MLKLVGALMTLNKNKILRGWNSVYCRVKGFSDYTKMRENNNENSSEKYNSIAFYMSVLSIL